MNGWPVARIAITFAWFSYRHWQCSTTVGGDGIRGQPRPHNNTRLIRTSMVCMICEYCVAAEGQYRGGMECVTGARCPRLVEFE